MRTLLTFLTCAVAALACISAPLAAQNVVITNAKLVTGDGSAPREGATLIVRGGKVVAATDSKEGLENTDARVIDAKGAYVTPGIFATLTSLGLWDVEAVSQSNDTGASGSPFSAALDVAPIINPHSQHIRIHRAAGITRAATAMTGSGSIFTGQGALIDLGSDAQPVMQARAFQMVNLGEGGASAAGGSRASAYVLFRNALREARALGRGLGRRGALPRTPDIARGDTVMLSRFDAEALIPVIEGTQKLYIHVERASDIQSVLRLKREFPKLDMVLVGASEGWLVARDIAKAGVPVIADALQDLPSGFDELASTQSNIGRMTRAGVKVALNAATMENPRRLAQFAGNLVALTRVPGASGLSWDEAFAAISSIPADISGMEGRAGVLTPDAWGDVVIWDGDPLEAGSVPTHVFIAGVEQDLSSHQSRLKERYRDLDESDLPKAYDW